MQIKILHITNHPGTILNANQIATYINNSPASRIQLKITIHPWQHPYYINKSLADEIFKSFSDVIIRYDMLLFTDTPMCARPFLQNLAAHTCGVIVYIPNRFDWGIWGFEDAEFYTLFRDVSLAEDGRGRGRVQFIADNQYDNYYAQHKANMKFAFGAECVRLTPRIYEFSESSITNWNAVGENTSSDNMMKLFIQDRGTPIREYNHILDTREIRYDVFDTNHRYRDRAHIAEYLGVLHLPYQVNIQTLMENLGAGIIHFLPSETFFRHLLATEGWYYWEERHRDEHLLEKSIQLAEWYSPVLAPCFIYFDSWDDLRDKYQHAATTTGRLELLEKKRTILAVVKSLNQENIAKWQVLFQRFLQRRPTIVSMFYNIRLMDGDISDWHRAEGTYYRLAEAFILRLPVPLVICMSPDNHELATLVLETRARHGLEHITHIHYERFEDTYFYQYLPQLEELRGKYLIYNGNPRHETPRYITLNNNKFHFLEAAIREDRFASERFIWMDMGINHVAQKPNHIIKWIYKIPDLIKQLCINPYLEPDPPRDLFHNIFHHTAGGLITGHKNNLQQYIELYKAKWADILTEGWYQIDEAIMTIVQRENRHLFQYYYGDYEGIIANYHEPDLSMNLIMEAVDKTVRHNQLDETFAIMLYLRPYFQLEWNQFSGHFYQYIHYNIVCDWWGNQGHLLDDVIGLVNKKLAAGDGYIRQVLVNNKGHLERYRNLHLIPQ